MSNDASTHGHEEAPGAGIGVADVYFVLFRRKWLVVIGLVLGIAAAAALWKLRAPLFESTAKIMVKYVRDSQSLGPASSQLRVAVQGGGNPLASECEILSSLDVARAAAEVVGPARILPDGPWANPEAAAFYIHRNLKIETSPQLDVITVRSRHRSPDVALDILEKVIAAYLKKHHEIHSNVGGSEGALSRRREQLRAAKATAEVDLKALKAEVGVYSLEDFRKNNAAEASKIRQELFDAEADLAQRQATLGELQSQKGPGTERTPIQREKDVPPAKQAEYATLVAALEKLRQSGRELAAQLTPDNPRVQANREQIAQTEQTKAAMEAEYPALLRAPLPGTPGASLATTGGDLGTQAAQLRGLQARINSLSNQWAGVQAKAKAVEEVEPRILKLQRDIELFQTQLNDIERALQQRQLDQVVGSTPNIQKVQEPSVPAQDFMALFKKMAMVLCGGLGFGIGLAFLLELVLDRSVRRPKDLEGIPRVPLFLSIPKLAEMPSHELVVNGGLVHPNAELTPFHEALRDRLVNYFEANNMTHKPKMVAVTGCEHGAGVSSVASGLAASLSEIGEGNVLLVDMRGAGAAHAFFQGKPACSLEEALEFASRDQAHVEGKLYLVSGSASVQNLERIVPRQFGEFVPKLKASDYEYIIFDMPPVSQTSVTSKVSRFMDMVLMVVESGKTSKEVVTRAAALLGESKATVGTVLNKHQRYVPRWLLHELD